MSRSCARASSELMSAGITRLIAFFVLRDACHNGSKLISFLGGQLRGIDDRSLLLLHFDLLRRLPKRIAAAPIEPVEADFPSARIIRERDAGDVRGDAKIYRS